LVEVHPKQGRNWGLDLRCLLSEKKKSNLNCYMKRSHSLLDHAACHYSPLFLVERDPSDNDLCQDQDMKESGPRQARIRGLI
jgi:hypothetical protein